MVIDRNETVAPLFWYLYKPLTASRRDDNHAVGGFTVALYPDHTLAFSKYNGLNQLIERDTFQLSSELTGQYRMIVDSQSWWLGKLPRAIKADGRARCISMFGFTTQHPMFSCEDIDSLVLGPFNSQRAIHARRLRFMLESMAEILFEYGIELGVDHFTWDWAYIRPLEMMQATPVQEAQGNYQSAPYAGAQQFPQDGAAYYENQDRIAQ